MKIELPQFQKIMEIILELYEHDPKYFTDCFFDMYFQMKKKAKVDEVCNSEDEIKNMWQAVNLFKYLVKDQKEPIEKAYHIAYKKHNVDAQKLKDIINSFNALKGSKKTRFKILL